MILVIVRHWIREDREEEARARVAGTTARMVRQPGLMFRHVGLSNNDQLVTVTGWRSAGDRAAWDRAKKAAPPEGDPYDVYSRFESQEVEVFDAQYFEPQSTEEAYP